jgi:hypothetical protein
MPAFERVKKLAFWVGCDSLSQILRGESAMGEARVIRADRRQLRWDMIDLEGFLPSAHRARIVSRALFGASSRASILRGFTPIAGWRGGVPVNHHGLADFRVEQVDVLDRLLTQSVTALIGEGLVSLAEIAIDGTKVRAVARRTSFKTGDKTGEKLLKIEAAVAERLADLKQELANDPGASNRRRQAAQERAAREVKERAGKARTALERLAAERKARAARHAKDEAKKKAPTARRAILKARQMRFPGGAVRPAYNAQIAVAPKEGVIVSIEMTDRRNDAGLAVPMVDDIARRYGKTPDRLLIDTSYATSEDIIALCAHAGGPVSVYTPPPSEGAGLPQGVAPTHGERSGKAVYALRKHIERINADRKNHGFAFLPVGGLIKAKAHALWRALANNLVAAHRLRIKIT